MGCGGSSEKTSPAMYGKQELSVYDRKPKISIRIGSNVKKLDSKPRVIFIFGGPGSRKGRIVDDLQNCYGFHHIYTEDIIYREFPRKMANVMKIETVNDIKEAIESNPSHITGDWIMSMIEKEIERESYHTNGFLVDYIPNQKVMIKIDTLLQNVDEMLTKFEEKYPISFALNLAVPSDKVLKTKQVYCATPEAKEKMKETGGQGDEADSGLIKRRAVLFNNTVKPFIDYFNKQDCLVTVDVTCGVADIIWHRVHELFCDLDFKPHRTVNTVILFAFDENEADSIDYDKYQIEHVHLASIVENPNDSVENLLKVLSKFIDEQSKVADSFVVNLSGTSVTRQSVQKLTKKLILFAEVEQGYIEKYLPGSPQNYVPQSNSTRYKAVCSVENEICLFPTDTDDRICQYIASFMTYYRLL